MKRCINGLIMGSSVLLTGCGSLDNLPISSMTEKMRMLYQEDLVFTEPPERRELSGIKNIHIEANKPLTNQTALAFYNTLQKATINNKPFFESITFEQSEGIATQLGLFHIEIGEPMINSQKYSESRVECPGDKLVRTCSGDEGRHYSVSCVEKRASLIISYKVTFDNEEVIPFAQHTETTTDKHCSDHQDRPKTDAQMYAHVVNGAGVALAESFIPQKRKRPNDMFVKGLKIEKEMVKHLKALRKQASKGEIDSVLDETLKLLGDEPNNGELLFNVGYLYQAMGQFSQAKGYFMKAEEMGVKSEKRLAKHLKEVDAWIQQGVTDVRNI